MQDPGDVDRRPRKRRIKQRRRKPKSGWLIAGTLCGAAIGYLFPPLISHAAYARLAAAQTTMICTVLGAVMGALADFTANPPPTPFKLQFGVKQLLAYVYIAAWVIYLIQGFIELFRY